MNFYKLIGYNTSHGVAALSTYLCGRIAMTRAFDLTASERTELTRLRDTAPQAYLRERAAALLKVADGMPAARLARTGLLRPRKPDTVYSWLDRFIEAGIDGLRMQAGRGRKPAFSPSARHS
jgi:hypothetical protein